MSNSKPFDFCVVKTKAYLYRCFAQGTEIRLTMITSPSGRGAVHAITSHVAHVATAVALNIRALGLSMPILIAVPTPHDLCRLLLRQTAYLTLTEQTTRM